MMAKKKTTKSVSSSPADVAMRTPPIDDGVPPEDFSIEKETAKRFHVVVSEPIHRELTVEAATRDEAVAKFNEHHATNIKVNRLQVSEVE